jgi:pyrroline-5-carboxylate reductase
MPHEVIAFIGGGHMARALIGGLLAHGQTADTLRVADPSAAQRAALERDYPGVAVLTDNAAAAAAAATWVLAVKPQHLREVATALAPLAARQQPLVISVAAGIRLADLCQWLGSGVPVIRSMPNRPALIGAGITALVGGPGVGAPERARASKLLGAVGACEWLEDEAHMDAVTAVSGSGPAYLFLLIEMLESAARAEGLEPATARRLAIETIHGSARMAREIGADPSLLREQVTSPGGTTAAALEVLENAGIRATFARAVRAARLRSAELADLSRN